MNIQVGAAILVWPAVAGISEATVVIDWVTVGDPGNVASGGSGSVGYSYQIGMYEVTNAQYVEFLNSADPNGNAPLLPHLVRAGRSKPSNRRHQNIGLSRLKFSKAPQNFRH